MFSLNYANGSGGSWLAMVLTNCPFPDTPPVNYHDAWHILPINLTHSQNKDEEHYVLSGSYVFNFWLNVINKDNYVQHSNHAEEYTNASYQEKFLTLYDMGCWLHKFVETHSTPYFDFDHLISNDRRFYDRIVETQKTHGFDPLSYVDFRWKRQQFLSTCIDPTPIYENPNRMEWIIFLMSRLASQGIEPHGQNHFLIYQQNNQNLCKEFVKKNQMHISRPRCLFLPNQKNPADLFRHNHDHVTREG